MGSYLLTDHQSAIQECKDNDGYLVTISSKKELDFIIENSNDPNRAKAMHISGSAATDNLFDWYFETGPETGILLYNLSSDYCYGYCPWSKLLPSLMYNGIYLTTAPDLSNGQVIFNNVNENGTAYVLCERVNEHYKNSARNQLISTVDQPMNYVIFDNDYFKVSIDLEIKIVFTMLSNSSRTFSCSSLEVVGETSYKCTLNAPLLTYADYNVSFSKYDEIDEVIYYRPIAMTIKYMLIGENNKVTIHTDMEVVDGATVWFGEIPYHECSGYTYSPYEITCTYQLPVNTTYLPITVKMNNLSTTSYKVAIVNPSNGLAYKFISLYSTFPMVYDSASRFDLMGLQGYAQSILTIDLWTLALNSLTYSGSGEAIWQNLNPCIENKCFAETGPYKGQLLDNLYRIDQPLLPTYTTSQRLGFNVKTSSYSALNQDEITGFIVEFSGYEPSFDIFANYSSDGSAYLEAPNIPTQGTTYPLGVRVLNAGIGMGSFSLNGVPIQNYSRYENRADIYLLDIPVGYGQPKLTYTNAQNKTTLTPLTLKYNRPTIDSVTPSLLSYLGGLIQIFGKSFGSFQSVLNVTANGQPCIGIFLLDHNSITCKVLPSNRNSSTDLDIIVTVSGQKSLPFTIKYSDYPTITGYSNLVYPGVAGGKSQFTIYGQYFKKFDPIEDITTVLLVSIQDVQCKDATWVSSKVVTCQFDNDDLPAPTIDWDALPLTIQFNSLAITSQSFFYTPMKECPFNCSNEGICDTSYGICNCFPGFGSVDCSISILPPPSRPQYNTTDGSMVISDALSQFRFTVLGVISANREHLAPREYPGWIKSSSKYSDFQYTFNGYNAFIATLEINFTINSESYPFASQQVNLYPYSTNYRLILSMDPTYNGDFISPIFLLEYNMTESSDQGCFVDKILNDKNPLIYEIVGNEEVFSMKFTGHQSVVSSKGVYSTQKHKISTIESLGDEVNPFILPTDYQNIKIFTVTTNVIQNNDSNSEAIQNQQLTMEVNVGFATIPRNVECADDIEERADWKMPLIISVVVIGAIVLIVAFIYVLKKKKDLNEMKDQIRLSQLNLNSSYKNNNNMNSEEQFDLEIRHLESNNSLPSFEQQQ